MESAVQRGAAAKNGPGR